jgi:hypothetical protein
MPKGSLIGRYTKIFFTFFQSGLLHAIIDYSGGMDLNDSGSLRFFCMQALGIMLEDVVQAVYRYVSGTKRGSKTPRWAKVAGYIWIVAFMLFWTTPSWFYPHALATTGEAESKMTTFNVLQYLIKL